MKSISPYSFSFFRIVLGMYLAVHFAMLIPYAEELFSWKGMLSNSELNPLHGLWPNILNILDSPAFVTSFVSSLFVLSILFMMGFQRRWISLLLWYGWVCLLNHNNLIGNPGIPFVGWLLLICAVIPHGEPFSLKTERKENWNIPAILYWGAWIIMGAGYTISGIDKWGSVSWKDGSALHFLLENPLARDWFLRDFFLSLPEGVLKIMTWCILGAEILFLPLALIPFTRKYAWLLMAGMHLGILLVVDFADLTFGMLMIHVFTFDPRWVPAKKFKEAPVIFFDGVCGFCNKFVDLVLEEDKVRGFRFSALQGKLAEQSIPESMGKNFDTVVLKVEDKFYTKSAAGLRIVSALGGWWRLMGFFLIVPAFLRDIVYSFIAKYRYKIFGKHEACRMPTPEERSVFLD